MRLSPPFALALTLPLCLAVVSDCQTVYDAPVLDLPPADAEAAIVAAMSTVPACTSHEYVGGHAMSQSGSCHTQGIARYLDTTMISCQDEDAHHGILDILWAAIEPYSDPLYSASPIPIAPDGLQDLYDHVVVGQALEPLNATFSDVLVPAVSSSEREVLARVDLFDGYGESVCQFDHVPADSDDTHLGAAALYSSLGAVYLAACSWDCAWMYIYGVDPDAPDCDAVQISATDMSDSRHTSPIRGTRDETWAAYNSLAVFQHEHQDGDDDVFLVAGHSEWLDTWQITGALSSTPHFAKLAKAEWGLNPLGHGTKGTFHEGMTIEQIDGDSIDIWAAPHDVGSCANGRECMRGVYQCRMDF